MSILEPEQQQQQQQQNVKQDVLSYSYFVLQGVISLLGYNAILGSLDYFASNFSEYNIYFYLPLPPMITFNLVSIIMPYIAQKIQYPIRIFICIFGMLVILVLLPITTNYLSQTSLGFVLIMGLSLIWGIFGQVFNSSLIGLSCMIDRNQVVAYNIGSSASGIIIILLRMIAVVQLDDDINFSTLIYFLSAGFINLIGFLLHFFYVRSQQYRSFRRQNYQSLIYQQEEILLSRSRNDSHLDAHAENDTVTNTPQMQGDIINLNNKQQGSIQKNCQSSIIQEDLNENFLHIDDDDNNNQRKNFETLGIKEQFKQYLVVGKYLMGLPFFMMLSNVCANMMYPAVSLKSSLTDMSYTWSCIWIIFMHNIANVVGKYLTVIRLLYNTNIIYSMVVFRFLHFIIFIMNASNPDSVFSTDWVICLNIIIFSFSAGYTDGALFILASEKMCTNLHREQGGFIMAFSLTFGIMIGIFLAMPFQNI